jgi:rare lipoprotein A
MDMPRGLELMRAHRFLKIVFLVAAPMLAASCAESEFLANFMKEEADSGSAAHKAKYKIGRPYQIKGVWYRPQVNYAYDQTGVASWYGPNFHGKLTANGEIFDMNAISAAHKTLPMPSVVRVTNLRNGKSMDMRLNDRGPFAHSRIIDLSKRAAQLLGFEKAGTAPVRVQVLERESRMLAAIVQGQSGSGPDLSPKPRSAPSVAVTSKTLAAPTGTKVTTAPPPKFQVKPASGPQKTAVRPQAAPQQVTSKVTQGAVPNSARLFIQAGAFSRYENANRVNTLLNTLAPSKITMIKGSQKQLFRVRLGPFGDVKLADTALARVIQSGYPEARIIVD